MQYSKVVPAAVAILFGAVGFYVLGLMNALAVVLLIACWQFWMGYDG